MDRPMYDIDWELLDRYVTGEGTPAEREALRQRAEADPMMDAVAEVMHRERLYLHVDE